MPARRVIARVQARIADLGSRLNVALAQRVQELARFRSDFLGRLRQILGERDDIRIVGDRFVIPVGGALPARDRRAARGPTTRTRSRGCGDPGTCRGNPARYRLGAGASTGIPMTGRSRRRVFLRTGSLSSARAIEVVEYLIDAGVPPENLLAAGFGEVPADRYGYDRRGLCPQSPHRIQAHRALIVAQPGNSRDPSSHIGERSAWSPRLPAARGWASQISSGSDTLHADRRTHISSRFAVTAFLVCLLWSDGGDLADPGATRSGSAHRAGADACRLSPPSHCCRCLFLVALVAIIAPGGL